MGRLNWLLICLPALVILMVQVGLVAWTFPLSEVMTDRDILYIDHPFHLYQINIAKAFADQRSIIGYDPFFEGGYIGGVTQNLSAMAPALFAWLTSDILTTGQAYKLYIVLASCLGPLFVVLASMAANRSAREIWIAGFLALLIWWASAFHWYHTAGMVASTLTGFFCPLFSILLFRNLMNPQANLSNTAGLGIAAAIGFFIHPQFPFSIAIFTGVFTWFYRKEISLYRLVVRTVIIGLIAIIPNLPWLVIKLTAVTAYVSPISFQTEVNPILPALELLGLWKSPSMGAKVYPLLFVASLWAVFRSDDRESGKFFRLLVCTWACVVFFAALSAAVPTFAMIQPNRLAPVGYLFLIIPAASGITLCANAALAMPNMVQRVARIVLLSILALLMYGFKEIINETSPTAVGHYGNTPPEVIGEGPITRSMQEWINHQTTNEARILFETSLGRVHDKGHMAGYLAMKTGREFVGGPYTLSRFSGFWDGWLFGRPIEQIDTSRLADYLRLYNIGWIIAHSEASKRYFDAVPYLQRSSIIGPVQTYIVSQPLTYFMNGDGHILESALNRIVIDVEESRDKQLILKYHYVEGLKTNDGSEIMPIYFYDDPQPFVALIPRHRRIELHM